MLILIVNTMYRLEVSYLKNTYNRQAVNDPVQIRLQSELSMKYVLLKVVDKMFLGIFLWPGYFNDICIHFYKTVWLNNNNNITQSQCNLKRNPNVIIMMQLSDGIHVWDIFVVLPWLPNSPRCYTSDILVETWIFAEFILVQAIPLATSFTA